MKWRQRDEGGINPAIISIFFKSDQSTLSIDFVGGGLKIRWKKYSLFLFWNVIELGYNANFVSLPQRSVTRHRFRQWGEEFLG